MKKLAIILALFFVSTQAWALIGVPCDPEKDFSEVYLVRNWQKLPHKNQEETPERVAQVNAKRLKNVKWTYKPEPNTPIYGCLSYGASAMADWWAIELNRPLGKYRSFNNGEIEQGFDPRKLEIRYRKRGKWNKLHYTMLSKCPVTEWSVPIRPKGYARLLVDQKEEELTDPVEGTIYKYRKNDYPMEGQWKAVVSKHWLSKKNDRKLVKAIHDHGPLYIQFEILDKLWAMGTHAVICIGYGKLKNGRIAYICHDSFGNFPSDYEQDARGAPAYRYVLAEEIDEAIVFPHYPTAKAYRFMGGIAVKFYNRGGRPIKVRRAYCLDPETGKAKKMQSLGENMAMSLPFPVRQQEVKVYVEADYYMKTNGKGYWMKLRINNAQLKP
ncbi:MAG: hypothetical protein PWR01_3252 [Clostridiales bacterium]|jgi:hypothetical protein|nr:hypothetical protein [Clostridiales bacterium]MDN5282179.1 hypothetical protein [Candidatus Ozemobacter sp.]